jgi:hypothetical protein
LARLADAAAGAAFAARFAAGMSLCARGRQTHQTLSELEVCVKCAGCQRRDTRERRMCADEE